ncbi:hypothetical protein PLICRDRAFT_352124 [Plicaturopsis crispa FD-325 SS-3]|uniref:F-box domain-containing protein n=1 Tax=Plicaturopsis crispa FD-325 SS-3 TaxID=944288 RepID=A0A0C9SXQ8_PLICR|nr:hypothetical protein PLICRDRAFT_352124 [Plicaturopsis crispa FD-325 SS-3]
MPLNDQTPALQGSDGQRERSGLEIQKRADNSCPISLLPVEILAEIFSLCSPGDFDRYHSPHPHSAPLVFCLVCRFWREAAVSTPALWSHIRVASSGPSHSPSPEWIRTWLSRSGSCPLTVVLDGISDDSFSILESDAPGRVVSHMSVLYTEHHPLARLIPAGILSGTMSFEFFSIPLDARPTTWAWDSLQAAHGLRSLKWRGSTPGIVSHHLWHNGPWSQLERLSIDTISSDSILHILQRFVRLKHFTYGMHDLSHSQSLYDVTAHTLTSLHASGETVVHAFRHLTLPALRTLHIETLSGMAPLKEFLSRSRPPLSELSVTTITSSEEELLECLQLITTPLTKLSINDCYPSSDEPPWVTDRFLQLMTHAGAGTHLLPHLRSLTFRCKLRLTDGVLADMIESRYLATTGALEEVVVLLSEEASHVEDIRRLPRKPVGRTAVTIFISHPKLDN